ncbi:vitamin B12/cobalamin outer membrane transporter [bacterium BMS3Bbin04]|nr:vitamin B12/cobalamin outer membrane transporter [bacterium BMS3Bbin04]
MCKSWKRFSVEATVHGRRHFDDFVLDHTRPEFYQNDHRADSYGGRTSAMFASSAGLSTVGLDLTKEEINSSNLGSHDRLLGGVMVEQTFPQLLGFSSTVTGNLYHHGEYGWHGWPGLSISRELGAGFRASGSADYSFRTPSFTELYYEDYANISNPDLKPERAIMWESGLSYVSGDLSGSVTVYQRYGYDLIDWVRVESVDPWRVQNYTSMTTTGVELDVEWIVPGDLFVEKIRAGLARNDNDRELGIRESKYALTHLRTQGSLTVAFALPGKLRLWTTGRYNDRMEYDDYLTLDARITRTFWSVDVYVEGSNLTDTEYEEFVGVPTPGRWIRAGFRTGIEFD